MKFATERPYADPEAAARKLVELGLNRRLAADGADGDRGRGGLSL
jgi:hypothetical protein